MAARGCPTVTPVLALFASSYGTEVAFRVFLFGLPFVALFAASVLAPHPTGTRRRRTIRWGVGFVVVSALTVSFFFSYYGKERQNYMPAAEVSAMERLYSIAPPGSLMLGATGNTPWAFTHYADYQYLWYLGDTASVANAVTTHPVSALVQLMEQSSRAYLDLQPHGCGPDRDDGGITAGPVPGHRTRSPVLAPIRAGGVSGRGARRDPWGDRTPMRAMAGVRRNLHHAGRLGGGGGGRPAIPHTGARRAGGGRGRLGAGCGPDVAARKY